MDNKYIKGFLILFATAIIFPTIIKPMFDLFCTPVTGAFAMAGMAENLIAWIALLPWVLPIIILVGVIWMWTRPDDIYRNY
jgi:hypothetical protein